MSGGFEGDFEWGFEGVLTGTLFKGESEADNMSVLALQKIFLIQK